MSSSHDRQPTTALTIRPSFASHARRPGKMVPAPTTPSLLRVINNFRQVGFKGFWHQLNYIGDTKAGKLVGTDEHGNKYYENPTETIWRHRWVDFASHDFNASQVTPEWHAWISHIRKDAPDSDPIMVASRQPWQIPHHENLTGTRGAFKTYSTTKPKVTAWEPKIASRS